MKNILVPVDFSDLTNSVISAAYKIAKQFDASIRIIHVTEPVPAFIGEVVTPQLIRDKKAGVLIEEHKRLREIAGSLSEKGVDTFPLLLEGPITDVILEQANDIKADLIVIGSHGHGPIYKAFVGSVLEGVLKTAKIPVLVVPVH